MVIKQSLMELKLVLVPIPQVTAAGALMDLKLLILAGIKSLTISITSSKHAKVLLLMVIKQSWMGLKQVPMTVQQMLLRQEH